ncbi:DUF6504 family protein [Limnochorda pilosa]|uniref:DUF6504 domain-containing protein n=1 Tax=Limnochorda pilosa TaxID=1555112 RepID=A0A0K2SJT5_LIMPI|nr:DUF6504 family protein [Limnochorda pilosa]BAS27376.1 hypothetical protein LIP_1529 [Limnochorda pilosa]
MRRVHTPIVLAGPGTPPGERQASSPASLPGVVPGVRPLPGSHFPWRGRRFVVQEVLDGWQEAGCWWEGEPVTEGFHVAFQGGVTGVLLFRHPRGPWVLDCIDD